jgi:hypothetical protein
MGHAGIGEQPPEVVLEQGQEVAQRHRHRRQDPQQRQPVGAQDQAGVPYRALDGDGPLRADHFGRHESEDAEQGDETRRLGHQGQKGGVRGGRPLVDVRRVKMERHRRDLEAQPGHDHDQRDEGDGR